MNELDHVTLNPHDGPRPDDNHMYYRDERQSPYREWVFIKFDTQEL